MKLKTPVKKFQTEESAMAFLHTCDSDHYFEWGDLRAWQPGAKPRKIVEQSEPTDSNPFAGVKIDMAEVRRLNISDGNKQFWVEMKEAKFDAFRSLHPSLDSYWLR